MNEREKYREQILQRLNERELLEQLAEESAEMGKAALKVIRACGMSNNITPVTSTESLTDLQEEIVDVLCVLDVLGYDLLDLITDVVYYPKWERWAKRLHEEGVTV